MQMRLRWHFLLPIVVLFLIAGCADDAADTPTPPPTESAGAESEPPTATPMPSPTVPAPTATPLPTATLEVSTPAPPETPVTPPAAALRASEVLASRLDIGVDQVEIAATEAVTWPDGCLDTATGGDLCTTAEVPGYRVALQVDEAAYVFHTDQSGDVVRLAEAPPVDIVDPLLTWQSPAGGTCISATFGAERLATGLCDGPRLPAGYATEADRQLLVNEFATTFSSFAAETAAGSVTFDGAGTTEATPSQQRRVAEWARLNATGQSASAAGAILTYRLEDDDSCDLFVIDALGRTAAGACPDAGDDRQVRGQLEPAELDQFYRWLDAIDLVEIPVDAGAGLEASLGFYGRGEMATIDGETLAAIQTFIAEERAALMAEGDGEVGSGDTTYIAPSGWSRVLVEEVGLSFERPANWSSGSDAQVWYANEAQTLVVGVTWRVAGTPAERFFPPGATVADQEPVSLGWGDGTRYELTVPDGAAALHVLVTGPTGELVYDFYASAPTAEELERLLPALSRMVAAVTVTDESQGIAGPVQVTVDFLAAWLRDENSPESAALLSQSLQEAVSGGDSIAGALGVPAGHQSFSVSWLSTRDGQSRVQVDLTYADGVETYVFVLVLVDDQWRIDEAAPENGASLLAFN